MSNLLGRRLRPADAAEATVPRSEANEPIGEVPRDPEAETWLLRVADGRRTARELVGEVARREGLAPEAARMRLLPVLAELVRRRALVVAAARARVR
jgi:hypothetical protein